MAQADMRNVIRRRFKRLIADPLALQMQVDNQLEPPPEDGRAWLRLSILPGSTELRELGGDDKRYRTPGIAQASVYGAIGTGDAEVSGIATTIQDEFCEVTEDGVRFLCPSVSPGFFEGAFFRVDVNCPFYTDEFK